MKKAGTLIPAISKLVAGARLRHAASRLAISVGNRFEVFRNANLHLIVASSNSPTNNESAGNNVPALYEFGCGGKI